MGVVKIHRVLVVGGSEVMTQRGSVVGCDELKIHRVLFSEQGVVH